MSNEVEDQGIDFTRLAEVEKQAWDRYAAAVISGRLAGRDGIGSNEGIAQKAAAVADAMLAQRIKRF